MNFEINVKHELFARLADAPPQWWVNLIKDPDIYIDIRKNNYINVYYNGGSIMKLQGAKEYLAEIHYEYIPLEKKGDYLSFRFDNNEISVPDEIKPISLENFAGKQLKLIKKRIEKFHPNKSEKGLQGKYITKNNSREDSNGFFIDSEFQFILEGKQKQGRVDLVWVDLVKKKLVLVELKTMGDERLYIEKSDDPESIDVQLKKYHDFIKINSEKIIAYYNKVFQIKKNLKILPSKFAKETSIAGYELCEKPILLVGDCSQSWIDGTDDTKGAKFWLNDKIKNIAHSCIYQGNTTFTFNLPEKTKKNIYLF